MPRALCLHARRNGGDPPRRPPDLNEAGRRGRREAGRSADESLADMLAATPYAAWRQLGVLDAQGRTAHHTGEHCVAAKGAVSAPGGLAIGNGLANDAVVPAILRGFQADPDRPLV